MTIEQMIEQQRKLGNENGIMVRCPKCNAGVGKWCRDSKGNVVKHAERVAATR